MGWIKMHKKLTEWGWYSDGNTLRVFLHLLLTANYEPSDFHGKVIEVGQAVFGRRELAAKLNTSEDQIRTAIEHLKSTREITIETTNKFSIATIVKWRDYQYCADENPQQNPRQIPDESPANPQQNPQQIPTSKNIEGKKEEVIPPISPNGDIAPKGDDAPKAKATFSPPTMDEVSAYCRERCNSVVSQQWHDFYTAKDWMIGKNKMKDWKAAVRTWERSRDNAKSNTPNGGAFQGMRRYEDIED